MTDKQDNRNTQPDICVYANGVSINKLESETNLIIRLETSSSNPSSSNPTSPNQSSLTEPLKNHSDYLYKSVYTLDELIGTHG